MDYVDLEHIREELINIKNRIRGEKFFRNGGAVSVSLSVLLGIFCMFDEERYMLTIFHFLSAGAWSYLCYQSQENVNKYRDVQQELQSEEIAQLILNKIK